MLTVPYNIQLIMVNTLILIVLDGYHLALSIISTMDVKQKLVQMHHTLNRLINGIVVQALGCLLVNYIPRILTVLIKLVLLIEDHYLLQIVITILLDVLIMEITIILLLALLLLEHVLVLLQLIIMVIIL